MDPANIGRFGVRTQTRNHPPRHQTKQCAHRCHWRKFRTAKLSDFESSTTKYRVCPYYPTGTHHRHPWVHGFPNNIRGMGDIDTRADLFALGALAYRLLTAFRLWRRQSLRCHDTNLYGEYRPLQTIHPELPNRFAHTIEAALSTDRNQRPADTDVFRRLWEGKAQAIAALETMSMGPSSRYHRIALRSQSTHQPSIRSNQSKSTS